MFRNLKIIAAAGLIVMAAGPAFAQTADAVDETARGGVKGALDRINAEAATRAAQDAALQTQINDEATARAAQDTTLQGNIDAEAAARAAADAAETTTRQAGDTALQNQIDAGTIGGLSCSNGQVAKFNGTIWGCDADLDTDTDTSAADCLSGQILVSDGNGGTCVELPPRVDPGHPNACPAFDSAMVDAAALATDLSFSPGTTRTLRILNIEIQPSSLFLQCDFAVEVSTTLNSGTFGVCLS